MIFATVLLAILLGIIRSLFPYIDYYHVEFERWVSQVIHQPVTIGKIEANWQGLYPTIILNQVVVHDQTKYKQLLKIAQLQVGIDVISSLLHWQFRPGLFHLSGAQLTIRQLNNESFNINGVNESFNLSQSNRGGLNEVFTWIMGQGSVLIDQVDVDWYGKNGLILPLTNLKIKLNTRLFQRQLLGAGTVADKKSAQFRFVLNVSGSLFESANIRANGYAYINNLDLNRWLILQAKQDVKLTQGSLKDFQIWFNWRNQQLQNVQTTFDLRKARVINSINHFVLPIDRFAAHAFWQKGNDRWRFAADQINLTLFGQHWPLKQLSIYHGQDIHRLPLQLFAANSLDLSQMTRILPTFQQIIPSNINSIFTNLQPVGQIQQLLVRREIKLPLAPLVSARFDFSKAGISPWQSIPGFQNINGAVKMTSHAGELKLQGKDLLLNYEKIFGHPLAVNQYSGTIGWNLASDGWKIWANNLSVNDSSLSVLADMNLFLPVDGQGPYIQLLGSYTQQDISQLPVYLPVGILHAGVRTWLSRAFAGGKSIQGQFLLQGPLRHFPFDDATGRFEFLAQIQGMNLNYAPGWPIISNLDAMLVIDGRHLQVDTSRAAIAGVPIQSAHAKIADLAHADLLVQGRVKADGIEGLEFIYHTPLQATLGKSLENLEISGPLELTLGLELPLYIAKSKMKVQGDVALLGSNAVDIPMVNTHLTQLQGNLQFTENSLTANDLTAQWLGQPISIQIKTIPTKGGNSLNVQLQGDVAMETLKSGYGLHLDNILKGQTHYTALLQSIQDNRGNQLLFTVNSDLMGVDINGVDPIKKTAKEAMPSQVQVQLDSTNAQNLMIKGNYDKQLSTAVVFKKNAAHQWAFQSGVIQFGAASVKTSDVPGWSILGNLSRFVWSDVQSYIQSFAQEAPKAKPGLERSIGRINLNFGQFQAFGLEAKQMNLQAVPTQGGWGLQLNSPMLVGKLFLPKNLKSQAIQGEFQYLYLTSGSSKAVTGVNPGKIPPLNLLIHHLYYKNQSFGEVNLVTFPHQDALQIDKVSLTTPGLTFAARGEWGQDGKGRQHTALSGNIKSDNLGAALTDLKITSSLMGGKGSAAFAITWPGAPYDVELGKLSGNFSFAFKQGQIINVSQSTQAELGLGRILNLLSLQNLPKRLSLNFSDLTSKGFNFDTMKGDFIVRSGNATTNNAYLEGTVAKVQIKGEIGLGAKNYNLWMMITPYVTSSLPVIAGVVGTPIVGVATFFATKIFGGVVNRITSQTYRVTGSWEEPVVSKAG